MILLATCLIGGPVLAQSVTVGGSAWVHSPAGSGGTSGVLQVSATGTPPLPTIPPTPGGGGGGGPSGGDAVNMFVALENSITATSNALTAAIAGGHASQGQIDQMLALIQRLTTMKERLMDGPQPPVGGTPSGGGPPPSGGTPPRTGGGTTGG